MIDVTSDVIAEFRVRQPEFKDDGIWPADVVSLAIGDGDAETGSSRRWGAFELGQLTSLKSRGMYLYAAHSLRSTYPDGAVCSDKVDSSTKLVVSAKSVADESVTFAAGAINNMSAGDSWLGSTSYGQEWLRLRRRAGMGAMTTGRNAFTPNPTVL